MRYYNLMKKRVQQYAVQIQGGFQHPRHVLKDFSRVLDTQNPKWDSTIGDGLRRSPIVRPVAVSVASCCFSALNAPVKLQSSVASPCCFVAASLRSLSSCTSQALNQKQKSVRLDLSFFSSNFNPEAGPGKSQDESNLDTVVKVYCIHTPPNYSLPWQIKRKYSTTGSAFIIEEGKILINARLVEHATQVKVKRRGESRKYVAKVLVRSMECDLALLSVESEEFWKGAEPLRTGDLPDLQDSVTVVGYPLGGDTISVTKAVVSCIKVISYAHGSSDLLGVQIDAAIKLGNSGGLVFNDQGECIGVAFQAENIENSGVVIPMEVISHFLVDYEMNGKYTGFPCLGVLTQKLESPALRECLKVPSNEEGVLVRSVEPTSDAHNVLKEGDVIVSIDDFHVDWEGAVSLSSRRPSERIAFRYLISKKFPGDVAKLGIIRAGEQKKVQVVVMPRVPLVPFHIDEGKPSYIIVAGFVFTPLSGPLIEQEDLGLKLFTVARNSVARFRGEQIVILSQVLVNEVNMGYEHLNNQQVLKFNSTPIKNIHHLAHLIDMCKDKYLVFEFDSNYVAVLEREASKSPSLRILKDYGVPSERSADLFEPYVDPTDDTQAHLDQGCGDGPHNGLVWI